jgi:uncharacterized membrane protein YukC
LGDLVFENLNSKLKDILKELTESSDESDESDDNDDENDENDEKKHVWSRLYYKF